MQYCITPEVTASSLSINAGESGVNGLSLYQPGGSFPWSKSFPLCGGQTARPVHGGQHPVSTSALRNARSRNEFIASSHPVGPALSAGSEVICYWNGGGRNGIKTTKYRVRLI